MSGPAFHEATHWVRDGDTHRGVITEAWLQGRTAFGGLLTAAGYEAAAEPDLPPLRTVTARLFAPVGAGELEARVHSTRHGRSIAFRTATLWQGGEARATVECIFGAGRESRITVPDPLPPPAPAPESLPEVPYVPGQMPAFTQNFAIRWTDGQPPFTGATAAIAGGWCRHRTEAHGVGALIGLLDAWPVPVLALGTRHFPASTVQWTCHFTGHSAGPAAWLRFHAEAVTAGDGYATTRGQLWSPERRLLGWMEQLVSVYD